MQLSGNTEAIKKVTRVQSRLFKGNCIDVCTKKFEDYKTIIPGVS